MNENDDETRNKSEEIAGKLKAFIDDYCRDKQNNALGFYKFTYYF